MHFNLHSLSENPHGHLYHVRSAFGCWRLRFNHKFSTISNAFHSFASACTSAARAVSLLDDLPVSSLVFGSTSKRLRARALIVSAPAKRWWSKLSLICQHRAARFAESRFRRPATSSGGSGRSVHASRAQTARTKLTIQNNKKTSESTSEIKTHRPCGDARPSMVNVLSRKCLRKLNFFIRTTNFRFHSIKNIPIKTAFAHGPHSRLYTCTSAGAF